MSPDAMKRIRFDLRLYIYGYALSGIIYIAVRWLAHNPDAASTIGIIAVVGLTILTTLSLLATVIGDYRARRRSGNE